MAVTYAKEKANHINGSKALHNLCAHSGDHERSNRSIMNTDSGDHEHAPAVS
jgi:hypothetical protein